MYLPFVFASQSDVVLTCVLLSLFFPFVGILLLAVAVRATEEELGTVLTDRSLMVLWFRSVKREGVGPALSEGLVEETSEQQQLAVSTVLQRLRVLWVSICPVCMFVCVYVCVFVQNLLI